MPTLAAFWTVFATAMQAHQRYAPLFMVFVLIAVVLWRWRPQDRQHIAATFSFSLIAMTAVVFGAISVALQFGVLGEVLQHLGLFACGLVAVRFFGLLVFRLVLPLFRIQLLRIFEDLAELAGYCAWLMLELHGAGLDLSSLVTTSAVMTAVLAFSMQDTLGNILGGLALQMDNSIKVGDWIQIDDLVGRVADIRWRYTAVETRNWETVIIPNSLLMKGRFAVLGRRNQQALQWRRRINFEVGYEHFPASVFDIVQHAIRSGQIANVANHPAASCVLLDFNPSAAHYALYYWLTDLDADGPTDSAVRTRIYAALQRAGIQLPYPNMHIHLTNKDGEYLQHKHQQRIKERMEALQSVELFNTLHEDELAKIAEQLAYAPFVQGDLIMRQGTVAHWLYILISGSADVFLEAANGERRYINTVHGGSFLGEMGLMTGEPRSTTAIASSEVLAYRLDKAGFEQVLAKRPEIAVEISKRLVSRRSNLDSLQQQWDSETDAQRLSQQQNILEKIRGFFRLSAA